MQTPIAAPETVEHLARRAAQSSIQRVHVLAWRDLDDAEAGGSEVHAHNVTALWAQAGIDVTMRTSAAPGLPATTTRSGYRVERRGSRYGVFARSPFAELTARMGPRDALVEIWNGMPFWSPLWCRGPRSVWLHHVHGPMWAQSLPAPVAAVGVTLEERIAPLLYRRRPIVTLSASSKAELVDDLGFPDAGVHVVPPGIDPYFSAGEDRSPTPLAVAVGRLTPVKDFPRLVRVMAAAQRSVPELQLVIVGEGYERPRIEQEIAAAGAQDWIRLAGRTSDEELRSLYRRAWCVVSASTREGWGMTLTEAAACGTPAVATDIAGHADAVDRGESGLLAASDEALSAAVVSLCTDEALRARLSAGAAAHAARFTWDRTARETFDVLADDALERAR